MITAGEVGALLGADWAPYPLSAVRPTPTRILEISAGTGNGTLQLAETFPHASVVSLEIDDASRTASACRLAAVEGMRTRVSILPLSIFEADFLGTFDLIVAKGLLARTEPEGRAAAFMRLVRRMTPGGSTILDNDFGPTTSVQEPLRLVREARFGEFKYAHWTSVEPVDRRQRTVIDEYTIVDGRGEVISRSRHERTEWVADRELIQTMIAASGLSSAMIAEGWMRLSAT